MIGNWSILLKYIVKYMLTKNLKTTWLFYCKCYTCNISWP